MTTHSYHQYCGLAYALDIVGERWTLLLVRELFAGPRRFKDLVEGLPGVSTNLLTDRLKHLEQQGLLCRRVLPPPAGSAVYELTPLARALEPALVELGKWGSRFVPAAPGDDALLHLNSYALTHKTFFRPEQAQGVDLTVELHIGHEVLQVHICHGRLDVRQGAARRADVVLHSAMPDYLQLLAGKIAPEEAVAAGVIQVEGNVDALRRFLAICGLPSTGAACALDVQVVQP